MKRPAKSSTAPFDPLSAKTSAGAVVEERLTFDQTQALQAVCGPHDTHLQKLESELEIFIQVRGTHLILRGARRQVQRAVRALKALYRDAAQGDTIAMAEVEAQIRLSSIKIVAPNAGRLGGIRARSPGQIVLLEALSQYDLTLAIGPAGSGKTFLAVAAAAMPGTGTLSEGALALAARIKRVAPAPRSGVQRCAYMRVTEGAVAGGLSWATS